jgi:glycosyltransferase involved in cell wall biosynthesis
MKLGSEKEVIKDEDVPFYFAAADVVLIQRKQILNSGNVPTAFLFKKVVVGPDTGNVGEILKDTGNPTFNSTEDRTITNALEKAFLLEKQGLGEKNYNYACQNWNIQKVAGEYKKVYKYLTNMLS